MRHLHTALFVLSIICISSLLWKQRSDHHPVATRRALVIHENYEHNIPALLHELIFWLNETNKQTTGIDKIRACMLDCGTVMRGSHEQTKQIDIRTMHAHYRKLGWQLIANWVGTHKLTDERSDITNLAWTSQVRQDETVVYLMQGKENGFYVDLAANSAAYLSNTLTLEKLYFWKGLCIEANPAYFDGLYHRQCQVIQAIVGAQTDVSVTFNMRNDGYMSGLIGDGFDNSNDANGKRVEQHSVGINKLFEDMHVPMIIDYLSLDIEGAEEFVFQSFAWDKYKFLCITVERPKAQLRTLLIQQKYMYICDHGNFGDELWLHESFIAQDKWVQDYVMKIKPVRNDHLKIDCPTVDTTFKRQ